MKNLMNSFRQQVIFQVLYTCFLNIFLGIPFVQRKMMTSTSPSLQISKDGEKWTFAFKVLTKSNSISFEVCKDQSHIVLLQHSC